MNRRSICQLGVATALFGGAMGPVESARAAAPVLAQWRWKSRLLLVFAPDGTDQALLDQRRMLETARAASTERDLVTIEIVGDRADQPVDPAALRRDYRVPWETFTVILIGKDGGEKLRLNHPVSAATLFGTIDRMLMRRSEAARQ